MNNFNSFSGSRVLVTGASGFIGGKLSQRLKALGANVFGVSRKKRSETNKVDHWLKGDLINLDFTRKTIDTVNPHTIFHLAGFVSGQRNIKTVKTTYSNNLTTTVNVLTVAAKVGIDKLILAGSMEEPGENDDDLIPVSPYAASKMACSIYARMFYRLYDTPVVIPRIYMVYGPGNQNEEKLIPYIIQSLINEEKPNLTSGSRLIDWIYIDDVVEGLIKMATADNVNGKTIDLGSGKQYSIKEVCKKITIILESDIELGFGVKPDRPYERIPVADLKLAKELLDWKPKTEIDEGLVKTVTWFKNKSN